MQVHLKTNLLNGRIGVLACTEDRAGGGRFISVRKRWTGMYSTRSTRLSDLIGISVIDVFRGHGY